MAHEKSVPSCTRRMDATQLRHAIIRTAAILQCCWAMSAAQVAALMLFAATPTFRAQPIWAGLRYLARLPEVPQSHDTDLRCLFEADHAHFVQARAWDSFNYWVEHAEVRRLLLKDNVRRCGDQRERLRLQLHAEGRSQLFLDADLGQHVSRPVKGMLASA